MLLSPDSLVRISPDMGLAGFDCGDPDLNEFLLLDAKEYLSELLAVTYLVKDNGKFAAFFSLANDKLTCDPDSPEGRAGWNKLSRTLPNKKRRKTYPAVKLGRLGVCGTYQRKGLGSRILDWLKISFITNNKTGCRFITVDAYNNPRTVSFYERNGFRFLTVVDAGADTRQMYFDLKPFYALMMKQG